jgi:hypothetical protein
MMAVLSVVIPGHGRKPANPESRKLCSAAGFRARRFAAPRNDSVNQTEVDR